MGKIAMPIISIALTASNKRRATLPGNEVGLMKTNPLGKSWRDSELQKDYIQLLAVEEKA